MIYYNLKLKKVHSDKWKFQKSNWSTSKTANFNYKKKNENNKNQLASGQILSTKLTKLLEYPFIINFVYKGMKGWLDEWGTDIIH